MTYSEFINSTNNKLELLLYIEEKGLPETSEDRIRLLTKLNEKGGYPVHFLDLIEWMPVIEDYWSFSFVEKIASEIKNPTAWKQEIYQHPTLTEEQKALILFALPL